VMVVITLALVMFSLLMRRGEKDEHLDIGL
jgi:hypothetical protein